MQVLLHTKENVDGLPCEDAPDADDDSDATLLLLLMLQLLVVARAYL